MAENEAARDSDRLNTGREGTRVMAWVLHVINYCVVCTGMPHAFYVVSFLGWCFSIVLFTSKDPPGVGVLLYHYVEREQKKENMV